MDKINCFFSGVIIGAITLGITYIIISKNIPTAIDVYRGKTTIEITYRDSIPIDSIVVYK